MCGPPGPDWLSLLALALGLTVQRPAGHQFIDAGTGIPNLARLLGDALVVASAWAVQVFLYHLYFPVPGPRAPAGGGSVLFVGTLLLLGVLFAAAPVDEESWPLLAATPMLRSSWSTAPLLAYVGFALIHLARPAWRYASLAEGAVLRSVSVWSPWGGAGAGRCRARGLPRLGPRLGSADGLRPVGAPGGASHGGGRSAASCWARPCRRGAIE